MDMLNEVTIHQCFKVKVCFSFRIGPTKPWMLYLHLFNIITVSHELQLDVLWIIIRLATYSVNTTEKGIMLLFFAPDYGSLSEHSCTLASQYKAWKTRWSSVDCMLSLRSLSRTLLCSMWHDRLTEEGTEQRTELQVFSGLLEVLSALNSLIVKCQKILFLKC